VTLSYATFTTLHHSGAAANIQPFTAASGRKPLNRAVADIVGFGDVPHRLSGVSAADRLLDLVGR